MPTTEQKKITIAYILPALAIGGAERSTLDVITRLDARRFQPVVVCFRAAGPGQDMWRQELTRHNIPLVILRKKTKLGALFFVQLWLWLVRHRPDIVHTQLGGDIYGVLAARLAGIRTIVSTAQLHTTRGGFKHWLKQVSGRRLDRVIAKSQAVADYVADREKAPREKIIIIPNGVDCAAVTLRPHAPRAAPVIGFLGRLSPEKGADILIAACVLLQQQGIAFTCTIAGDGAERERLQVLVQQNGLAGRVTFIGWQADSRTFLQQVDIVAVPSRWEGFGKVILEAGALGIPVVASDTGGIREVLDNGQAGILVPVADAAALARVLASLIASPDKRQELGARLYRRVCTRYALSGVVKAHEDLYQQYTYENTAN